MAGQSTGGIAAEASFLLQSEQRLGQLDRAGEKRRVIGVELDRVHAKLFQRDPPRPFRVDAPVVPADDRGRGMPVGVVTAARSWAAVWPCGRRRANAAPAWRGVQRL